ncbi:uncharacterized protein LOC134697032 [Mytilus trossulus]|uniref:uncharacterized protein LOC134697032 n=1 Tax=Mytilus trossulus TaxID=6551 RepID=UPI00300485E3
MEDQVLQQNTVQGDMIDEPCAPSNQPGTITAQRPNNSQNGTITHIGTNNSYNMYDSPSYLENVPFTQTNINCFQSALPVGATVSDDVKGKIWANEYINFDILLPEDDMIDKPIPLSVERDNQNQPRLVFNESTGSKKIRTIDQWISAFSAYMVIYCQKFTDAFEDLVTYMETVREIAKSNGQWLKYDKKFRKAKCQLRVSWANMHQELWLKAMQKTPDVQNDNYQSQRRNYNTSNDHIPQGFCVRFHSGNFCQLPCKCLHKCYICNKLHPASKCWHTANQQSTNYNQNVNTFRSFRTPFQGARPRNMHSNSHAFHANPRFPRPQLRFPNFIPITRR